MLLGKRVEPAVADQVVTELIELGYLDDARYAQRFAEDRRRLDAWGSDRIARRLRELGVDREHIDAALAAQDPEEEMDGRARAAAPPLPDPPPTARSATARSASSSAAATARARLRRPPPPRGAEAEPDDF
jgi:regulatory protein